MSVSSAATTSSAVGGVAALQSPAEKAAAIGQEIYVEGGFENFDNGAGQLETRDWSGRFGSEFQNSDSLLDRGNQ